MEENKPKKSKALIITIIILLVLLIAGYLIYQNRDSFGVKASGTIAKIFSPLAASKNSKSLQVIAQAGEDIKKGDSVSVFGTGTNNNPIVVKTADGSAVYGVASEDISTGEVGQISTQVQEKASGFWNSFSNFIGGIFGGDNTGNTNTNTQENNTETPTAPTYECKKDGVEVSCSSIPVIPVYECKKDGVEVDCSTVGGGTGNSFYECTENGVSISCSNIPNIPVYVCKKDGVEVDCSTVGGGTGSEIENSKFPSVTVASTPSKVSKGAMATISWTSKNATSCDAHIKSSAGTGTSGSFSTGRLETTTSYTVTCTSANNGSVSGNVVVFVGNDTSITKLPIVTVTATPSSVDTNSESTIKWSSKNATSCDAGSTYRGTGTSGSFKTGRITTSRLYTVTCTGLNGSKSSSNTFVYLIGAPTSCTNGTDNFPLCTTIDGKCKGGQTNPPLCTVIDNKCTNGATNPPDCTTIDGKCINGTTNPPDCTTEGSGKPDLVASKVLPTIATLNATTNISSVIMNRGTGSTRSSFSSFFTINNTDNPVKTLATVATTVPSLDVGISGIAETTYKFTSPGKYSVRACADKSNASDQGKIEESAETNNCGDWTTITVTESGSVATTDSVCENGAGNYPSCDNFCTIDDLSSNKINDKYTLSWHTTGCNSVNIYPEIGDTNTIGSSVSISPTSATTVYTLKAYNSKGELGDTDTITINKAEVNQCLLIAENPLVFTDAEKAKLAELLSKFYIIAPTLKTSEDISIIYKQMENYKNLIASTEDLTQKCYAQTIGKDNKTIGKVYDYDGKLKYNYTGPTERRGNPWYSPEIWNSYIPKDESGANKTTNYCTGKTTAKYDKQVEKEKTGSLIVVWAPKQSCSASEKQVSEFACTRYRYKNLFGVYAGYMNTGCTWVGGFDDDTTTNGTNSLRDYEKLLNIW